MLVAASTPAGSDPWAHDLDPQGSLGKHGGGPILNPKDPTLKGRNGTCNLGMNHLPTIENFNGKLLVSGRVSHNDLDLRYSYHIC